MLFRQTSDIKNLELDPDSRNSLDQYPDSIYPDLQNRLQIFNPEGCYVPS
jgi:hypothetical protein